jgi:hypothetical protein
MNNDDLAARLAAVEDRLALIELEGLYARTYDAREGEAWAALFTPDGIYQARGATPAGSGGSFVQGRAALARFCSDATYDGIHFLHLPQLTISGDRALGRVHLEFVSRDHGEHTQRRMAGYYDIEYARVDGRWLIKHRVTTAFARHNQTALGYPVTSGLPAK